MQAVPDAGEEGSWVKVEALRGGPASAECPKEPCDWGRVSVTKGRGGKCADAGATTVSQNTVPALRKLLFPLGGRRRLSDCVGLNAYTNK